MRRPQPAGYLRQIATGLLLVAVAGCTSGGSAPGGESPPPDTVRGSTITPSTTVASTASTAHDSSDPCTYVAAAITEGLTEWTASDDIMSAPIAGTRLGPQSDGGVPGVLVDGCIWEVHGPDGGHIGVAVERFTDVDMDALAAMSAAAAVTPLTLADGQTLWDVPPSGDSPSGAVLIGDSTQLVVIRVESYSDNLERTFLIGTLGGSERFFRDAGDAVEASR